MSKLVGRPRALDETKQREICALVSAGASKQRAADYVGCSLSTINREAQRNEAFRTQLRRSKATQGLAPLQAMRQAAQTDGRAAAWMLERTDPEQYGRRRPHALGRKELRLLSRDLLRIFNNAIDHPILQEQVAEQVQATLNYVMRHAWDTRRTGDPLREAMKYFARKDAKRDFWEMPDFPMSFAADRLADQAGFAPSMRSNGAKGSPASGRAEPENTGIPAANVKPMQDSA